MTKKKVIIILLIIALALPLGITFSKYAYTFVSNYLMEANNFFFNSNKLSQKGITYNINNWSGVSPFTIQFELNNHKNNILTSAADITYDIEVTCSEDITCALNSTSGVIYVKELTDNFVLSVTPQRTFDTNEKVTVDVVATSSSPYVKTLSAKFIATVGKKGISYEINDEAYQPYLNFTITNALDQYKVLEAFDNYSVGNIISSETYLALSDTNKAKCASAIVTLSFDPNKIILDTTTNILKTATTTTTNVGGVDYISSITFKVEAVSSNIIRFYKKDKTLDHTYPFGTDQEPIITFNTET